MELLTDKKPFGTILKELQWPSTAGILPEKSTKQVVRGLHSRFTVVLFHSVSLRLFPHFRSPHFIGQSKPYSLGLKLQKFFPTHYRFITLKRLPASRYERDVWSHDGDFSPLFCFCIIEIAPSYRVFMWSLP